MGYRNLAACVADLERHNQLRRIDLPVDPHVELAAIQRRALTRRAPALLFTNVRGTRFPMLANMFGTRERVRFIFRDTLRDVENLFHLAADPSDALRHVWRHWRLPFTLNHGRPRRARSAPVLETTCALADLPRLVSWPGDGGPFVTLPQVYTEQPGKPGWLRSNLGMYRVQLGGNDYAPNEAGMHYQIHRGIGYHHAEALRLGQPLPVNIFVGGPPAMTLAAILPSPEGIPEVAFAGMLAGFRVPFARPLPGALPVLAEADFCISGVIAPYLKKEGPFGDHLGYYSLAHDFPVLKVQRAWHRKDAIWPFTSVGRPPQEDTMFGEIIHELTAPLVAKMFPGVHEVHAVDAAGVHPLLLAIGSERYVPWTDKADRIPQELLTCGLALLGSTQTSLSKFVLAAAKEDAPGLRTSDTRAFFRHMLERTKFERDLHFVTRTTMDTLDYSGISLNQGSKLLWAAVGDPVRRLAAETPPELSLPDGYSDPRMIAPGILALQGPPHTAARDEQAPDLALLAARLEQLPGREAWPLVVVADDARFIAENWENFLWIAFTRADPATDIHGANASIRNKHWSCSAPLILDARRKRHHAPPLEPDPVVERRIDAWGAPGGPLHGLV